MEMSDITFTVPGADTIIRLKVHQLATYGGGIYWGSFIGVGSSVKALRASLSAGLTGSVEGDRVRTLGTSDEIRYDIKYAGLGSGNVHVTLRFVHPKGMIVVNAEDDAEWHREFLRLTTAPVLREWVPYLRGRAAEAVQKLTCIDCDVVGGGLEEHVIDGWIVEGADAGEIEVPEAGHDFGKFEGRIGPYIHAYAASMITAAGGTLAPVFDPETEPHRLLPTNLRRQPFVPQGWLIEAVSRHLTV